MNADRSVSSATLTASIPEIFRGACKMLLDPAAYGIAFISLTKAWHPPEVKANLNSKEK